MKKVKVNLSIPEPKDALKVPGKVAGGVVFIARMLVLGVGTGTKFVGDKLVGLSKNMEIGKKRSRKPSDDENKGNDDNKGNQGDQGASGSGLGNQQ